MIITSKQYYTVGATVIIISLILLIVLNDFSAEETVTNLSTPEVEYIDWSDQHEIEATARKEREERLLKLKDQQEKQAVAASELPNYRETILSAKRNEWTALLKENWAEYERLLGVAKLAKNGRTYCTICEGDTYLDFCIFCEKDSNGVCAACRGKGKQFIDEICPACQGDGECFMCTKELHQMICPFCNDGDIDIDLPSPSLTPISR